MSRRIVQPKEARNSTWPPSQAARTRGTEAEGALGRDEAADKVGGEGRGVRISSVEVDDRLSRC